jgi:hypothetical protein
MYELATQFGVHRTTVATSLEELGIPLHRQGQHGDGLQEAVELYTKGWSLARLGSGSVATRRQSGKPSSGPA